MGLIIVGMENKACNKGQPAVRKAKKKTVKDELDRMKQAEKKKRRLEKALATSAAIRSELEKKKQQKKEEQQRLDEEGAAIAEAVALHVLIGEDSDDSRNMVLNKEDELNHWGYAGNINLLMSGGGEYLPHHVNSDCAEWVSNSCGYGCEWADLRNNDWAFTGGPCARDLRASYFNEGCWGGAEYSAGLIAAQAVSALQITEDGEGDTIVLNGMLGG